MSLEPNNYPYVIARTYSAGVFAGYLSARGEIRDGYLHCTLINARRLWHWEGAASLSQLAQSGTSNPNGCRFPEEVSESELFGVVELLKCTEKARNSIKNVAVWKK